MWLSQQVLPVDLPIVLIFLYMYEPNHRRTAHFAVRMTKYIQQRLPTMLDLWKYSLWSGTQVPSYNLANRAYSFNIRSILIVFLMYILISTLIVYILEHLPTMLKMVRSARFFSSHKVVYLLCTLEDTSMHLCGCHSRSMLDFWKYSLWLGLVSYMSSHNDIKILLRKVVHRIIADRQTDRHMNQL